MNKTFAVLAMAVLSFPALAQQKANLDKPLVVNGKTYKYQEGMPYVEKGELKNKQPELKRDPTPVEKVVKKIMDSPVQPTIVNGQPGVKYQKSLP